MKRFPVGQKPDVPMKTAEMKVKVKYAQMKETFQVGTKNGLQNGQPGDVLVQDDNGDLSVMSLEDFKAT